MLFRFSLYGFLKNLRFFEAFLLLALLERGFDFAAIGLLITVREVTVFLLEVPSGAAADALGRRRCMVVSMAGYVVSHVLLGLAGSWWLLALAMVLFGAGDAFRSGTHKAMILAWLRQEGRLHERTQIYGYTRSWSKIGSACSALLGGGLLLAGAGYPAMFLASALMAAINLVNLATYPRRLDEAHRGEQGAIGATWHTLAASLRDVTRRGRLRPLVLMGATAQASYEVAKDYLQPVLLALVLTLPGSCGLDTEQRVGIVVGAVSCALYLLASLASRKAHAFEARHRDADAAAQAIVTQMVLSYAVLTAAVWFGLAWAAVLAFLALAVQQNLWRPIQVGRVATACAGSQAATVLSVEAQLHSLAIAVLAPVIGTLVDLLRGDALPGGAATAPLSALLPLGLLGLPLCALRLWQPDKESVAS